MPKTMPSGRGVCRLARRGLRGIRLVTSDAHEGLKKAIAQILTGGLATLPGALHAQHSGQSCLIAPNKK